MKIVYLCLDRGIDLSGLKGASIHVRSLVRALAELGHDVLVIGTKVGSPAAFEAATGATVVRAPLAGWNEALGRGITAANRWLGRGPGRGRDVVQGLHNTEFSRVVEESAARLQPSFVYERYSLWGAAGERLARKWSQLRPETRVLFMSGFADSTLVRHEVINGDADCLLKPFTAEALARKVRETLDSAVAS